MWAHYSLIIIYLNTGTPRNCHFPFETNGKVVVLGVPILKYFRVVISQLLKCGRAVPQGGYLFTLR